MPKSQRIDVKILIEKEMSWHISSKNLKVTIKRIKVKFINSQQIFTELTHQLWFIQPRKLLATLDTELQCKDIKSTKTTNPKKANQNCFVVHVVCIYLVGPHGPRLMVFLFTLHTLYIYSKALRSTFFGESKNSCSSKSC